ncbi:hypothetical protein [Niabella drilacis]|uniref:Uncharacterized protein n=1 Tax=Niabella drilacis (strain DSM 25811 / CCM 8410 / CCUG 62505 / LMG 26954 / E90) TaxID=1285928 RepID=A0A1G6Y7C8_NIADE|nr:hypothetical protein [Niabella drilacis]SDD86192.1 hypothetical protein SAMN04487894_1156 [Niabella drilacis]
MRILYLTTILLLTFIAGNGQNKKFEDGLHNGSLDFKMPENFDTLSVTANPDMNYELALKSKTRDLEIRYSIRPLKERIEQFEKRAKDSASGMPAGAHPNKMYQTVLMAVIMNTSGNHQQVPGFKSFPPEAVKREFNADWGATTVYPLKSAFGKGYSNCMLVTLHRDNQADVYIFYLFNNKEDLPAAMPAFHALKFKE